MQIGRIPPVVLLAVVMTAPIGCGASEPRRGSVIGQQATAARTTPPPELRPPALVSGSAVGWAELQSLLAEAAGRVVLEEIALGRALDRETGRRGITISEQMVRAEEDALLEELALAGPMGSRVEVLDRIRAARGLGPRRFEGLLRRNAALRALVAEQSRPQADEIDLAERIAFGPAYRVRLFVSPSDREAAAARERVLGVDPQVGRTMAMSAVCTEGSAHASGASGGLIERFSPFDPAYPAVVRDMAAGLAPGDVSPVMATPGGFAFMLVEEPIAARTATDAERTQIERRLRIRKERLAMERLASELLGRTEVSPIDPDLARAWREGR
jgi:hypothetical protein